MSKRMMFVVFFVVIFMAVLVNFVGLGSTQAMPIVGVDANAPATTAAWPYRPAEFVISALDNEQYIPSVAFNWKQREYLVVWHNLWGGGNRDIYAQRVSQDGELRTWFHVGEGAQPSVEYDPVNDRYLVAWIRDVGGGDWDVFGRFVSWNGASMLSEFNIVNWNSPQWTPKVAYGRANQEFLVVWTSTPTTPGIPAYVSGRRIFAGRQRIPRRRIFDPPTTPLSLASTRMYRTT